MWYSSVGKSIHNDEPSDTDLLLKEAESLSVKSDKPKPNLRFILIILIIGFMFLFSLLVAAIYGTGNAIHEQYSQWMSSRHKHDLVITTNDDAMSNQRPNFVFIVADDLGFNSIGYEAYDLNSFTPHLSSLVKNGVSLTNYYAQEKCTPSRAAMLTGRYPIRLGMQFHIVQPDYDYGLNTSEVLLTEILRDHGSYMNYGIGKWHIGHYSANMLPGARGFHQYLGYNTGEMYYWSKKVPFYTDFTDLIYMDKTCYAPYTGSDFQDYSTFLFRDKAIQVIQQHDYTKNPMFLYLGFQAVHVPYNDIDMYLDGVPSSYFADGVYESIKAGLASNTSRLHYALSLVLMDQAVESIVKELETQKQIDNTYIIFVSDNGGCTMAGARNGQLRGNKGTLFEGGLKVDGFIYSPLLPANQRGANYSNLMHVTDWLPTILSFANVKYSPANGHELDGVDHSTAIFGQSSTSAAPRQQLVHNLLVNVDSQDFDLSSNGPLAVRNERYKLIHEYTDNSLAQWFDDWNNHDWSTASCRPDMRGNYEKMLFDLVEDPNETNNLYGNERYDDVLAELYALVDKYAAITMHDTFPEAENEDAKSMWITEDHSIIPWVDVGNSSAVSSSSKLSLCTPKTFFEKGDQ